MEAAGFDPKKFPYNTKDPELIKCIEEKYKLEATPLDERLAKLDATGKGNFNEY